jgi:hypothetical protein
MNETVGETRRLHVFATTCTTSCVNMYSTNDMICLLSVLCTDPVGFQIERNASTMNMDHPSGDCFSGTRCLIDGTLRERICFVILQTSSNTSICFIIYCALEKNYSRVVVPQQCYQTKDTRRSRLTRLRRIPVHSTLISSRSASVHRAFIELNHSLFA